MDYIKYFIIGALVIIMFKFVKMEVKKSESSMNESNFALRQPKIFLWIGIIGTVFLTVCMIIFPNDTGEWWVYLIFSLSVALGLWLIIYCLKWELNIKDNEIIYSPFIGKKKLLTMNNITRVKYKNGQKLIAFDGQKKLFSVEFSCRGFNVLVSRLKNEQIHFE